MSGLFMWYGQIVGSLFSSFYASFAVRISKWMLPGWYTFFENL